MTATPATCACCGMRRKLSAGTTPDGKPLGLCHTCTHDRWAGRGYCSVRSMRPSATPAPLGSEWDVPEETSEDATLARLTAVLGYTPDVLDVTSEVIGA